MSGGSAQPGSLELIERIDNHAVGAWPSQVVSRTDDGWTFRAAGGIGGWRLNHALTPCRPLSTDEVLSGLERSAAFARQHGTHHGLQVSPLHLHDGLVSELASRGWTMATGDILVLTAEVDAVAADAPVVGDISSAGAAGAASWSMTVSREPDDEWLAAWVRCDPERDVEAQRRTVLPLLAGRAHFCRLGDKAVGIAVAFEGLVGLFSLAVAPDTRRQGLGRTLVREMLAAVEAETAYLQVDGANTAGLALYESLGFSEVFRYRHCVEPGTTARR